MLCFFLWYPPSALGFGTALTGFTDEIVPAVLNIMFVLVVPSFVCSRVGSGGFLGEAFLLRGFGGWRGIFAREGFKSCGLGLEFLMIVLSGVRVGIYRVIRLWPWWA